jgi:hypothetical protein
VVIKSGERVDACSDSDERWPDGCGEKKTSRDGRDARAAVLPAGKRRVGAIREC